ncbi:hypothetical protein K2173_002956 [Erythroxylum novogranatense]|uniref:Uncharacterized protein n=1 Tax=Erythroxylum novogranatense TaxID=1862640 RepID=A0AAV8TR78_9ROSI|nr:hypothetical protein K2173_002956 [Erythroxylum novogranatense]
MPSSVHLQRATATLPFHKQSPATFNWRVRMAWDTPIPEDVACLHMRPIGSNQCCSVVVQTVNAPVSTVWSVLRRFDNPQAYKHFLKSCQVIHGDGDVGTLREVQVVSGLPAASSTERLEILDDERHVMSFSVIGGEHRLTNYRSVTTLHLSTIENATVVTESYVVDIPPGNTKEDTCSFLDTIVRCNLQSLAQMAESMDRNDKKIASSQSS